jgi:hypothetical protein
MLETDDGIVLKGFHLRDAIGRNIICDDGVQRRVEQISHSYRYADKVLINEVNEDETPGGAWVHALSLACQMHGGRLPTQEEKRAFSRTMQAFRFEPERDRLGTFRLPSGISIVRN